MTDESKEAAHFSVIMFISHPHKYQKLAEVLRGTIIGWTGGTIKPRTTTDYGAATQKTPITTGGSIRTELEETLRESNVILLLYVDSKSANWCMYEAGFAKAGGLRTEDTRLIVFQCTTEVPSVFGSDLRITLTADSIRQFTRDFHRNEKFFPGFDAPYAPELPDDHVEQRGKDLHSKLMAEWQLVEPDLDKPPIISPRWILFTVSLEDTYVNQIYQLLVERDDLEAAIGEAQEMIEQYCMIERTDPHLMKHFGLSRVTEDRKFHTLYHRWKDRLTRDQRGDFCSIDWWSETCRQIALTIRADDADSIKTPFKSAAENLTWYLLVVTQQRTIPAERKTEFDCTLIRVTAASDYIQIKASLPDQPVNESKK
jgi:hypothetical protein